MTTKECSWAQTRVHVYSYLYFNPPRPFYGAAGKTTLAIYPSMDPTPIRRGVSRRLLGLLGLFDGVGVGLVLVAHRLGHAFDDLAVLVDTRVVDSVDPSLGGVSAVSTSALWARVI